MFFSNTTLEYTHKNEQINSNPRQCKGQNTVTNKTGENYSYYYDTVC